MVVMVVIVPLTSQAVDVQRRARALMVEPVMGVRLARFEFDAQHLPAHHAEHGLGEQQQHGGELDGPRSHREGKV